MSLVVGLFLAQVACGVPQALSPVQPSPPADASDAPRINLPSLKGLNYGTPRTTNGDYVGTEWLRSGSGQQDRWGRVRPALAADLAFIRQHDLGSVVRIFIGLDQAMTWDPRTGYIAFDETTLANLGQAFDIFDANGIKVFAVLYDQENTNSAGNFRFEALDGRHPEMRAGYLKATEQFLSRFGSRSTVVGWDLFNEAYNSLSQDGNLPKPVAGKSGPASPGYETARVRSWLQDLYRTAKQAAPQALFTISDSTELYGKDSPDLSKYDGIVDFYDVHVYDDHPRYPAWSRLLKRPYIVGEAGAGIDKLKDQKVNPGALRYLLDQAFRFGVSAVLAHSIEDGNIFVSRTNTLTATGSVLAAYREQPPGP